MTESKPGRSREEIILNGKPLSECTTAELVSEHNAGMSWEAQTDHWSDSQEKRLNAVEAELSRRPASDFEALAGDDQ